MKFLATVRNADATGSRLALAKAGWRRVAHRGDLVSFEKEAESLQEAAKEFFALCGLSLPAEECGEYVLVQPYSCEHGSGGCCGDYLIAEVAPA